MSRGWGRVQWGCLLAIWHHERRGEHPTTFDIAAEVYKVKPDKNGDRLISDAQHVAVKRALEGLQRQRRVIGFRSDTARALRWRISDLTSGQFAACGHKLRLIPFRFASLGNVRSWDADSWYLTGNGRAHTRTE